MGATEGATARTYFIRPDYAGREQPDYFEDLTPGDAEIGLVWQPDVYPEAARIARVLGSSRIIDIGCGNAGKLVTLTDEFEIVGVDFGVNLESARRRDPGATWIEFDLENESDWIPVDEALWAGSVVINSDVIEHLRRPEHLLRQLRRALDHADAVVLSTPDRERTWGPEHLGPPPNPHHVREWSAAELGQLLGEHGFEHLEVGWTRSNDEDSEHTTVLARMFRDAHAATKALAEPAVSGVPKQSGANAHTGFLQRLKDLRRRS